MSLDLRLMLVWLAAYLAAGAFYVLRGLGDAWNSTARGELGGLSLVALCWLPITFGNLMSLHRTHAMPQLIVCFGVETVPPLALLLVIVAATGSLPLP